VRQLHVIGVSDDGDALLLGPGPKGKASHQLPLDDRLRAVVRGQLSALNPSERAEIALTPKEIQARLRAGATPEEVAKAAQVPVARVLPYAAPVLAERERIVEQARAAVLHRTRGPAGERPMGEVVDLHLADVAKPDSVEWTARRRKDGAWVVLLSYASRGGRRTASWLWRAPERDLTALDVAASRLAAEEATTAKKRPARKAAVSRPAAKKAAKPAAKRTATKKAAKPAAKKAASSTTKRAAAQRTAAKPAARKATATVKRTAPKPVARRTATKAAPKPAAKKVVPPTTKRAAPKPRRQVRPAAAAAVAKPATRAPKRSRQVAAESERMAPVVRIVPDPAPLPAVAIEEPVELAPVAEAQAQPARRSGRVPVPSWSDVLLGVAPRDSDGGRKS
jgi:hypothetical protein